MQQKKLMDLVAQSFVCVMNDLNPFDIIFVLSNILNFKTPKCFFIYFFEPTAISHT